MKTKAVSGIMLTLLLTIMLALAFNIQSVKSDWTWTETIYIRADGSVEPDTAPISSVDNVSYTFTDNIYDEIVVERSNVIVDGNGYTLQGIGSGNGFSLTSVSNVTIKNTNINNFTFGIRARFSSCSVSGNNITNNGYGIWLESSYNNSLYGNNITNNNGGISLADGSWRNNISRNNIKANNGRGIGIYYWSGSNSIYGNNITNNNGGILIDDSSYNTISGNNVTANNDYGICITSHADVAFAESNIISGNILRNHNYGVYLVSRLRGELTTYNNTICENSITNTSYGIYIDYSSNNIIYHNNFINNTYQVQSHDSTNVWDDGYPSGGNYWSDYIAKGGYDADGDGIGDIPYVIAANNRDRYPLMEPWSSIPTMIKSLIRTVVFWNLPKGTENGLTSKLDDVIQLLNKGNENGAIHKLVNLIDQVEALRGKKLTNEQADYLITEAQRIIDLIRG